MADDNVIVNGTFDEAGRGWSGNDIEANHQEKVYLHNGESGRVAEMDGKCGQTTVMEQSFEVNTENGEITTEVTFDSALRDHWKATEGEDGYTVEVLNSSGEVIADMLVLPSAHEMTAESMSVTFPAGGVETYTLRFTEVGDDNSFGALLDNVSLILCFAEGTLIETDMGEIRVEDLALGMMIKTQDNGFKPLQWIGGAMRCGAGALAPILFKKGSMLGNTRDLRVSPEHRMLIDGWRAELLYGVPEVLVAAKNLVNDRDIRVEPQNRITYYHLLFDRHEIVFSEGIRSESFYPCAASWPALDTNARNEILELFPQLEGQNSLSFGALARPALADHEAAMLRG